MSWTGMIVGISVFVITGLLHPAVVKGEYYFGKRIWPVFAVLGAICCAGSLFWESLTGSIILAVLGFSFFWCILELYEQEGRVKKGWFPANPKRVGK